MAFKDLLMVLTTYPDPTPVAELAQGVDFAAAIGAKISAVACEVEFQIPGSIVGNLFNVPALAAAESKKSSANAQMLLTAFQEAAEQRGVFHERRSETCLISDVADVLIGHARLRDLTIVPVGEGGAVDIGDWYVEQIVFESGRPTLIIPKPVSHRGALNTVVVAWDFSRPAARTIADAIPILAMAKRVYVVTVTGDKAINTRRSGAELSKHLAHHDVEVTLDTVDAAGRSTGDALDSYVASREADLLVMGAYGHSRIRDFILGGATKSMLAWPSLPIFLSH
ncbi:MAG: universal stress protein [Xanthobacteraceae bacterium]|nr:universal stress protein [Xanthobacteraceae bacterium]